MSVKKHSVSIDMLHGTLLDKIILFALPLAASSILQQLFNSADVAVVGRFAGKQAMAAVGGNSAVINLIINLFVGLSVGANVVIANYIGQDLPEKIKEAVHTVAAVALISGVFLLGAGQLIVRPILIIMKTPPDVLDQATLYLRIYFLGMPFLMAYNFGAAVLRSMGDTRRPLFFLTIAGVINVGLNLLLVIVFHLDVAGVAIATVVSNSVSAALVVITLVNEEGPIKLDVKKLSIKKEHLLKIAHIGVPSGIQGMVFSLSNVCIQTAVNGFGSSAAAGSSAADSFEFFTYFVTSAFTQAAVTFTSQNYGAGKLERCKKIFWLCMLCGLAGTGLMSAMFVIGSDLFIRLFTVDAAVIAYAVQRVLCSERFIFLTNTYEIPGAGLRGMGYSMLPACITLVGSCAFRFLWVFTVFKRYPSFTVLMSVYPASWIITGCTMLTAYFIIRKRVFAGAVKTGG